jgi:hypothetical protein
MAVPQRLACIHIGGVITVAISHHVAISLSVDDAELRRPCQVSQDALGTTPVMFASLLTWRCPWGRVSELSVLLDKPFLG